MDLSDFDYVLPPEAIAQAPAPRREAARLLVHDRASGRTEHTTVAELPGYLAAGDLVVANDTRVRRARVLARRPGGGRTELLFLAPEESDPGVWRAMVRPAARLRPGMRLDVGPDESALVALDRPTASDGTPGPEWRLRGETEELSEAFFERHGELPLPPYVQRPEGPDDLDADRYQTVYAGSPGAVAAPTAGLHLTEAVIERLRGRGVAFSTVTLHVGAGTFRPVDCDDPRDHRMHTERFELGGATASAVEQLRAGSGRLFAVGTTSLRTLESCAVEGRRVEPRRGLTDLFLLPGSEFRVVDGLLTNFHLPRSTLFMLVCAFAGTERMRALYEEALAEGYRFASYGDAMLLL